MRLELLFLLVAVSCTGNKNFAGAGKEAQSGAGALDAAAASSPETSINSSVDTGDSGSVSSSTISCVEGDRIVLSWSGPIKDCMDSGRTWHFELKSCVDIRKAGFGCDWDTLQGKLKELNLLSETLKSDAAAGAKLVSCGQSADGNRIAVQWLRTISADSCQTIQEGAGITTGCYTRYVDREPPPPAVTDAERRQRVNECLMTL